MADYKNLDILLENDILNDDVKETIKEEWDKKVKEIKEHVAAEVRDEFAAKFERDKASIIEGLNLMVMEHLTPIIEENSAENKKIITERVQAKKELKETNTKFADFVMKKLTDELKEFKEDRKSLSVNILKADKFIATQIGIAVKEMEEDRQNLISDRVKYKLESKKELKSIKAKLVTETAKTAETFIKTVLESEISEMKEDIQEARKNNFGKKIFEAYGAEFSTIFFNENKEFNELNKAIKERDEKLATMSELVESKEREIDDADSKVQVSESRLKRQKILEGLLKPLYGDKREVMEELLSDVKTINLTESYNKYIPELIEESSAINTKKSINRKKLKEITGDGKATLTENVIDSRSKDIIDDILGSVIKIK